MNLIMEADAHGSELVPDNPEEIDEMVRDNIKKTMMKSVGPNSPPRAGKIYADFAREVNNAMEDRDANLATHMVCIRMRCVSSMY